MWKKLKYYFRILCGLPKSILFNLRHFPFRTAIRCPIILDSEVKIIHDRANITIPANCRTGQIKFGFGDVGIFDRWRSRTLLELGGKIVFEGYALIGHGSRISVFDDALLKFGPGFSATAEMTLICTKEVIFAPRAMIGWSAMIMDSDLHLTENPVTQEPYVCQKPVYIGENSWVGTRALVLKGSRIPADTIVAAGAVVCKDFSDIEPYCVLAGSPATVRKKNVRRI